MKNCIAILTRFRIMIAMQYWCGWRDLNPQAFADRF